MIPQKYTKEAVWSKDFNAINDYISANPKAIKDTDKDGDTLLLRAAITGWVDMVKHLLQRGADPNQKCRDGVTALMGAALEGKLEVVKILVAARADVNAKDRFGVTPLMNSAQRAANNPVTKFLLSKGANAKVVDGWKRSALDWAKDIVGNKETFKMLMDAGAPERGEKPDKPDFDY